MDTLQKYVATKIVPVAVVENEYELKKLADLCMQYIPAIELTMRTEYAMTALEVLGKDYPELAVAAATILNVEQAKKILQTGIKVLISPGFTTELLDFCFNNNIQYVPGVSSPAELETCLLRNIKLVKFFPAEVCGGIKWIQAMTSVYAHTEVKFMPLGGVSIENVRNYLNLEMVSVCGGSWICPKDLIKKGNWKEIERRFQEVQQLLREY